MNRKNVLKWGVCSLLLFCLFFVTNPMEAKAATKAKYYYKTYDKSKTYTSGKVTIKDSEKYKRVILKGNSVAVKKINKKLKALCDSELKSMPAGNAETDVKYRYSDDTYLNEYTSKVTYNDKGVISIIISYEWYQGGVYNHGVNGYTFSLKTGKQLKLTDVCKGNNQTLTKQIRSGLKSKYKNADFYENALSKLSANKCNFYLKKGNKAVVFFQQYDLSYGAAGTFDVTLKSKYK
ncbi:MAG: DUF3298 domain-containing protein [Eubacteriales bacterium]|nr:DUF3298 domain-containing protein [Eubacteriales bacterium]